MAIAAEAAARLGKVLTRKAATESPARTAEMAPAKAAADMSATTETATLSTPTSPAARRRVSGQSPGESSSRRQDDHDLT
jgi:hypothetical protein